MTSVMFVKRIFSVYYFDRSLNGANVLLYFYVSFTVQFTIQDITEHEIIVPGKWIVSGALVEFEVVGSMLYIIWPV